jgi:hypothetical protein
MLASLELVRALMLSASVGMVSLASPGPAVVLIASASAAQNQHALAIQTHVLKSLVCLSASAARPQLAAV